MEMRTTTHRERNTKGVQEFAEALPTGRHLNLLQVGPGASIKGFGGLTGKNSRMRWLAKPVETLLRRVPLPDNCLESYETLELLAALSRQQLDFDLLVCDINPRVLDIVSETVGPYNSVDYKEHDIAQAPVPGNFDGIVCVNVLCRITDVLIPAAIQNLKTSTVSGGIILTQEHPEKVDSSDAGLRPLHINS